MKISLITVTSIDGFLTNGSDPNIYKWTSLEDQNFFFKEIEKAKLICMGAKTYENAKHLMKHKKGRMRVVFTRNPEKYISEKIPGILEFTEKSPEAILETYEKQGIKKALIVGGSEINTLFLESNLITDVYITVEPLLFGSGKKITSRRVSKSLELISCKKINLKGTMLFHYKVIS